MEKRRPRPPHSSISSHLKNSGARIGYSDPWRRRVRRLEPACAGLCPLDDSSYGEKKQGFPRAIASCQGHGRDHALTRRNTSTTVKFPHVGGHGPRGNGERGSPRICRGPGRRAPRDALAAAQRARSRSRGATESGEQRRPRPSVPASSTSVRSTSGLLRTSLPGSGLLRLGDAMLPRDHAARPRGLVERLGKRPKREDFRIAWSARCRRADPGVSDDLRRLPTRLPART